MMTDMLLLAISSIVLIIQAGMLVSATSCPQHVGLPGGWLRQDNTINNRALFRLDLRSALKYGYEPHGIYQFRVHTSWRQKKFDDVVVFLDNVTSDVCGVGRWIIESPDLYSPADCPDIVTTQQKQPMGKAVFKWQAPACGCVHIRVRIHAESKYYLEDEINPNGPLARTICPKPGTTQEQGTKTETEEPNVDHQQPFTTTQQLTRNERLRLLCKVSASRDSDTLLKEPQFHERRTMTNTSDIDHHHLGIELHRRQRHQTRCCAKKSPEKQVECFDDVRRRRIDVFCSHRRPSIPFTKHRHDWMFMKQQECCRQLGEARYQCFNATQYTEGVQKDGHAGEVAVLHMDDLDPANDIEDYPETLNMRHAIVKHTEETASTKRRIKEGSIETDTSSNLETIERSSKKKASHTAVKTSPTKDNIKHKSERSKTSQSEIKTSHSKVKTPQSDEKTSTTIKTSPASKKVSSKEKTKLSHANIEAKLKTPSDTVNSKPTTVKSTKATQTKVEVKTAKVEVSSMPWLETEHAADKTGYEGEDSDSDSDEDAEERSDEDSEEQEDEDSKADAHDDDDEEVVKEFCCDLGTRAGKSSKFDGTFKDISTCFTILDKFKEILSSSWHKTCDMYFVVSCMQVRNSVFRDVT